MSNSRTIKIGSVQVKIYETPVKANGRRYPCHTVRWHFNGKTFNKKFGKLNSESRAVEFAKDKAHELNNGEIVAMNLSPADVASYGRAVQLLKPLGMPLELAVADYVTDQTRKAAEKACPPFPEVVDLFIARKKTDGTRSRHLKDITSRLETLKPIFSYPINKITAAAINEALDELQTAESWANRTRNHYRSIMLNCCNYAKANQHLPRDWHEFDYVPKLGERDDQVTVYTPEQAKEFMAHTPPALVPAVACMFFAGIRHSEVAGSVKDGMAPLDWRDINLTTGEVFIAEGKVRTAGQRFARLSPNALRWLRPHGRRSGRVCPIVSLSKPLKRIAKKAGFVWLHNGARHSYISYRLAKTKDIAKVSEETGTNPATLRRRYRRPISRSQAVEYFGIVLGRGSRKIVQLPRKAKALSQPVRAPLNHRL